MADELLTTREVAAAYRLSERTVSNWRRAGRLPFVRLGRKSIRFRASDVAEALGAGSPRGKLDDADAASNP